MKPNRPNTETYIECLAEVALPWVERVASGEHYVWLKDCAMPHKLEKPVLAMLQIATPLIIISSMNETPTKLCATPTINRRYGVFTNLNKETVGKVCSHLVAVVEVNGDFFKEI